MMHPLLAYFHQFTQLSSDEEDAILLSMVSRSFQKDDTVVREGDRNQYTYFVLKGLVKQFRLVNSEEVVTGFYTEGQWIIAVNQDESLPAAESLVCLEDTELVLGNEEKAQQLFNQFPRLESVARQVMEQAFTDQLTVLRSYQTQTPEQRYQSMVTQRPNLLQRVSQYHIAAYIGVKPESLSRIRKRIAQR